MKEEFICTSCGTVGAPSKKIKGNIGIEIFLWFLLIFPGIFYSIWRSNSKYTECGSCKSKLIIPINSPSAKKLLEDQKSHRVSN